MACCYLLKQFRTFLDFTLDPLSERILAILERFGLRRLVHYKWSFLGEYATKVLKRSTPHPGIKIGSKCQQIPLHALVCPPGSTPSDGRWYVHYCRFVVWNNIRNSCYLNLLGFRKWLITGADPRTTQHWWPLTGATTSDKTVETIPPVSKHLCITIIPIKQNRTKRPPPHPFSLLFWSKKDQCV